MEKTKAFIDRKVFDRLIAKVGNKKGDAYKDVPTIYRDLSRLVVGFLANTKGSDLQKLYKQVGWEGNANVRAIRACAKAWLDEEHPNFPQLP